MPKNENLIFSKQTLGTIVYSLLIHWLVGTKYIVAAEFSDGWEKFEQKKY